METVLWVLGAWFLASLPAGLFIGWMCSLTRDEGDEQWIADVQERMAA